MNSPDLQSVRARRAEIAQLLRTLKTEDADLAVAERVLLQLTPDGSPPPKQRLTRRGRQEGGKSQRALVLEALAQSKSEWLDVAGIISYVAKNHAIAIPRKTLSPLLTYLKNDGLVVRDGRRVALKSRIATKKRIA